MRQHSTLVLPPHVFAIKPLAWALFCAGISIYTATRLGVFDGKPVAVFQG